MIAELVVAASLWQSAAQAGNKEIYCYVNGTPGALAKCFDAAGKQVLTPQKTVVPIEGFADSLAVDLVANAAGSGLDLLSSQYAFDRGCREGNWLGTGPDGRTALKMGAAAIRGAVAYVLRRKGHKKAGDVWRYAGLGTDLLITGSNIRCGRK